MIFYRHLNPNPNLVEKNKNFEGVSGSLIFSLIIKTILQKLQKQ
jgi:hypothetical protein